MHKNRNMLSRLPPRRGPCWLETNHIFQNFELPERGPPRRQASGIDRNQTSEGRKNMACRREERRGDGPSGVNKQRTEAHLPHRYSETKLAKKNMYWVWLEGIPWPVLMHPAEGTYRVEGRGCQTMKLPMRMPTSEKHSRNFRHSVEIRGQSPSEQKLVVLL